jgi:N-methylhydantoinase A
VEITTEELQQDRFDAITKRFHLQHKNLYGYCLAEEATPVELIYLRLVCIGKTRKPEFSREEYDGSDPSRAVKESRNIFMPQQNSFRQVEVLDGDQLRFGNRIFGPALVEQVNTTVFVTPEYNLMVDRFGSYTIFLKGNEAEVEKRILGI